MLPIHDFATWVPLLRLVRVDPGYHVSGMITRGAWSVPVPRPAPVPGRSAQMEDMQDEWDAVTGLQEALKESGLDGVSFVVTAPSAGRLRLHLLERGPAVETGLGPYPGSLILVDGAVPEPWRRLPEPVPGAMPARSADPALLERTLRERLPEATAATETEIAATEVRLGVTLPEELKTLYRVTSAQWPEPPAETVGCELFPLDELYIADVASRPTMLQFAATEAVATGPEFAVQQLVGSPGWIAFGDNGGGDRFAVDLTPGPAGHAGQIILISHEWNIGAQLYAESLTDMVVHQRFSAHSDPRGDGPPFVAPVNMRGLPSIEAAADPRLEVLVLGVCDNAPLSLDPVIGLPRLRTLRAYPGTLADPLQIAALSGLEYLGLAPQEWRILLDAGAVPRGLLAAGIEVNGSPNPLKITSLANEILALWNRPLIKKTVLEGDV